MDYFNYILIGFIAQLVDSSLGMAFGTLSSSLLLAFVVMILGMKSLIG